MNINASIIDQRVSGIVAEHPEWLPRGSDIPKKKSAAFVLLCMSTRLDATLEDSADWLTEGGNDAGVDGRSRARDLAGKATPSQISPQRPLWQLEMLGNDLM